MDRRRIWFVAFQVFASAILFIVLARYAAREDYWGDEAFTVRRVEASWAQLYNPFSYRPPAGTDPFDTRFVYDFNPPFYFALVRVVAGAHPSRLMLRMFSILPMISTILLLGWGTNRKWGRWPAVAVTVAFCLSPSIVYYGHEARPYALGMLIATMLILGCELRFARRAYAFVLAFVLAFIGCMTHFHIVWLVLALIALNLVSAMKRISGDVRFPMAGAAGMIAGLALGLLCMSPARQLFMLAETLTGRTINLKLVMNSLFIAVFREADRFVLPIVAASLFLLLGVYLLIRSRRGTVWFLLWLIPACAPILAHFLFRQSVYERYALFAVPGWILFLAWMVHESTSMSRVAKYAGSVIVLAIVLSDVHWFAMRSGRPFRSSWRPVIEAFYSSENTGDHYAVRPEWLAMCFATNAGSAPKSKYFPKPTEIPQGAMRIWVIERNSDDPPVVSSGWRAKIVSREGGYRLVRAEKFN